VTINRPEARNALSMAVRERLALLFDELAVEEGMRAFLDKRKPQYRGT
jgi:enoyl-CoA hydratase/carnithine racemase